MPQQAAVNLADDADAASTLAPTKRDDTLGPIATADPSATLLPTATLIPSGQTPAGQTSPEGKAASGQTPAGPLLASGVASKSSANNSRYAIVKLHAKGGLGLVSMATDRELTRTVALKEIQYQYANDSDARARFVREAEITGRLEHPGIVPVYGFGVAADGRPYYAMRFIQGRSLKDAIDDFQLLPAGSTERSLKFRDCCAVSLMFVTPLNTPTHSA